MKFRGGGAPYRIRTDDPLFTRQVLWPAELRRQGGLAAVSTTVDSLAHTFRKQKPEGLIPWSGLAIKLGLGPGLEWFPVGCIFVLLTIDPDRWCTCDAGFHSLGTRKVHERTESII